MKRKLIVIALAAALIALLSFGTLAYFTASSTAQNVITMGNIKMKLHYEEIKGPMPITSGESLSMPMTTINKAVYVENTGTNPFYVRIKVDKVATLADKTNGDVNKILLDINLTDWTLVEGYYYYNTAVAPNDKTKNLFSTVTFDSSMGNEYMDAKIEVNVSAQAVQSENNGGASPMSACGWPAN